MKNNIRDVVLAAISKTASFDELSRVIVETCANEFNAEVCSIWRRYEDDKGASRLRLLAASAKAPQTLAQEITYGINDEDPVGLKADGVTGYVAQTRKEVHVASFEQLKNKYGFCWKGRMDKTQWEGHPKKLFRSLSAVPLILGDQVVGVLKLENKRGSRQGFPEEDRIELRELVPQIAFAVHSFNLLEHNEERLIQVPARMVATLLRPFETKHLVNEIVKTAANSLHAEICSLWLVDVNERELRLADGIGFSTEARADQTYRIASEDASDKEIGGITAWVAVRKRPFWANSWEELKAHPSWKGKWDKQIWKSSEKKFRCLYAVPLIRHDAVIGVLKVENRRGEAFFTDSDRVLCGILASLIVLVLDLGQQLRSSLISDLAHLIRSPIGQVSMNLSGLEGEIKKLKKGVRFETGRMETYVDFIKRALLAINVAGKTLVAYAQRASELTPGHKPEKVSLVQLVEERIKEFNPLLYSGIKICTDFTGIVKDMTVELDITDRTRLQIVIDNLLHNAIKYSHRDSVVNVKLDVYSKNIIFTIQDYGKGISELDLPRIFEAGFTKRAKGHPQGTGMGLTTVNQILDRLGWDIKVFSQIDSGTKFQIIIPKRKDNQNDLKNSGRR